MKKTFFKLIINFSLRIILLPRSIKIVRYPRLSKAISAAVLNREHHVFVAAPQRKHSPETMLEPLCGEAEEWKFHHGSCGACQEACCTIKCPDGIVGFAMKASF